MASVRPIGDPPPERVTRANGCSSRSSGSAAVSAVRYITPQRLDKMIRDHEVADIMVGNPHVYLREEAGPHKRIVTNRLGFTEVDPLGLLNPGKMRSFIPRLPGASQ
jgi:hypothetical protein